MNINSKISLITSNTAPSSSELGKGELAYGTVDGLTKLYGNDGSGVAQLNSPEAEQMLYFSSQDELNEFLLSGDVPTGGWYATVADTVYEQYGEWVVFKLEDLATTTSSQAFKMTKIAGSSNGDSFYGLANDVDFGPDGTGSEIQFGNYAHTRYLLYLDYSTDSTKNWAMDFNFEHKSNYSVDIRDMDKIGANHPGHLEVTMDNYTANPQVAEEDNKNMHITTSGPIRVNLSGYLVVKEILSDGEPWINWNEYIEPEPTTPYVQFDLSSTLGSGINSVEFSNMASSGTLNTPVSLTDSYNIQIGSPIRGASKVTIDANIPFFGMPDYNFPNMDIQWYDTTTGGGGYSGSKTIAPEYDSSAKIVRWQGSFTTDGTSTQSTARAIFGQYLMYINVMNYYEGDSPQLTGTLKIEDA